MAEKKKEKVAPLPGYLMNLPQPPARKAEDLLNAYSGYPYTAISAIAQEVASTQIKLFKKTNTKTNQEKIEEIFEHPALSVLQYANEMSTQYELFESTQIYLELLGEAYWIVIRTGKTPREIYPVRPDWVQIVPDTQKMVKEYIYNPGGNNTDKVTIPAEMVVPFKTFNPKNPYRGRGAVQAAAIDIDIYDFSKEWNRSFFFNSALPGLVFTTDKPIDEKTAKRFLEHWKNNFGGKSNAHKVAFMGSGFKPDKVTQTMNELDFMEQQKMLRDDILATFKVPKTVLGLTDDVNRANAFATTRAFMERVITPRIRRLVLQLNEFYLPMFGEEGLFFDFVDPAPEDVELELKIIDSGLKYGWLSVNEARAKFNYDPVDGGDELKPAGQSMQEDQPNEDDPQDEDNKDDDKEEKGFLGKIGNILHKKNEKLRTIMAKKTIAPRPQKVFKHMIDVPRKRPEIIEQEQDKQEFKTMFKEAVSTLIAAQPQESDKGSKKKEFKNSGWSDEQKIEHWTKAMNRLKPYEEEAIELVRDLLEDDLATALAAVDANKSFMWQKGKEDDYLPDYESLARNWLETLLPFLRNVIIEEGDYTFDFLGTGQKFDPATMSASAFLESQGAEFVSGIIETTRDNLRRELVQAFQQGESVDQIKGRIRQVFEQASGDRAETIARTEVLRASNFASDEAYNQSGIVEAKEWLVEQDNRLCEFCEPLNGKVVDVDGDWFKKGDSYTVTTREGKKRTIKFEKFDVRYPPLHPRCRCTLIPVLGEL